MVPVALAGAGSFWKSFLASSSMITASEFGDKTFFITSIMSVRKSRLAVFIGSMAAMTVMNVLSIFLGRLTTAVPSWIIHYISVSLFALFGLKMIYEGITMSAEEEKEEFEEAQKIVSETVNVDEKTPTVGEGGGMIQRLVARFMSKNMLVAAQVFSLVFFAEWGDKSQLATILLAAREGVWPVGVGAFVGYLICNSIAVIGSRALVHLISVRVVTIVGGVVFLISALLKACF